MNLFAIKVLLFMSSLLAVHDIPDSLGNWKVLKPWQEVSDVYEFSATSSDIVKSCKFNSGGTIEFPSIVQGAHEIFLDGQLIESFGDKTFESVRSFYGAPIISCSEILKGRSIEWRAYSYAKYFARFSFFPEFNNQRSHKNFWRETAYVIACGGLLILSLFTFIIFLNKVSNQLTASVVLANLFMSLYFMGTTAEYFGIRAKMITVHRMSDLSAWIGFSLVLNALRLSRLLSYRAYLIYLLAVTIASFLILFGGSGDVIQLGTTIPFVPLICLLVLTVSKAFGNLLNHSRTKGAYLSFAAVLVFAFCGINEMLVVTGLSNNVTILSFGMLSVLLFTSLSVNDQIDLTYQERDYLRQEHAKELLEKSTREFELSKAAELGNLASQVAHDIRSPLTALDVAISYSENLPDQYKALLVQATRRIKDIANDLLRRRQQIVNRTVTEGASPAQMGINDLLYSAIEEIVSEKRILHRANSAVSIESKIDRESYFLCSTFDEVHLKRVLSNLIDNAVEAMMAFENMIELGQVIVRLYPEGKSNVIEIADNGRGISSQILQRLGKEQLSNGKPNGNGLGVFHAQNILKQFNGKLEFKSKVGEGTQVRICIPQADSPKWLVRHLDFKKIQHVVIIDDELSIHGIWKRRLSSLDRKLSVKNLVSSDNIEKYCSGELTNTIFLVDFLLKGSQRNGIQIIEHLNLSQQAILTTSQFADPDIQKKCLTMGLKILPKTLVDLVSIEC